MYLSQILEEFMTQKLCTQKNNMHKKVTVSKSFHHLEEYYKIFSKKTEKKFFFNLIFLNVKY